MALHTHEFEWLKRNMGKLKSDISEEMFPLLQCLSDQCAIEEDGYVFATNKGQRLLAFYSIN
jgi:hypothetical protein